MRAMLLAAGLGTRLRPLSDERPKPAVPVGLDPLAGAALRAFERVGVSRIDANAHHLADVLERVLAPVAPPGIPFRVHREDDLLGTGGGIRAAVAEGPRESVVVMNGDIRFAPNLDALAEHQAKSRAVATLVVRSHPDPYALGAVEVDRRGHVLRIAGRPQHSEHDVAAAYVFTGVHLLAPEAVERLPREGCVVRQAYQPMLAEGMLIDVVVDESPWADLGTIPAYFSANVAEADGAGRPRGLVHEAADVHAGAHLERCVVGRGARIGRRAVLRRVIVWDGATIDEPLDDAIVTERGIVRLGSHP